MKKLLITNILLLISSFILAQVWKPVQNKYSAKYYIYVTKYKYEADIIAFQVEKEYQVIKPGLIYLAPVWYSKGTKVFFTDKKYNADFILFWTKNKWEAKWKM